MVVFMCTQLKELIVFVFGIFHLLCHVINKLNIHWEYKMSNNVVVILIYIMYSYIIYIIIFEYENTYRYLKKTFLHILVVVAFMCHNTVAKGQ